MMCVAIYARFSSDLQDARSITDQLNLCRAKAAAEGWAVAAEFSDAAISGANTVNRPGLNALMAAAGAGTVDMIVTESLDRLSRDLADIATLWRQLSFLGVEIHTLHEGQVGFMHVGLKGIVGQMFLADLAAKTRRGHIGRLRDKRIPGGRSYGYDLVPGDAKGLRTINDLEAAIVRRIFADYDAGRSARDIAGRLNRENVPSPSGGQWNASTINGSAKRATGILQNRLYIGEIVYGRQRWDKNPATGKRVAKPLPKSEWLVEAAPHLAIVDRELYDRVTAKRAGRADTRPERQRRPRHIFSGLLFCGCCGGPMIVKKTGRVGCSYYANRQTCANKHTARLDDVEMRVLGLLREHLLAPEVVAASVEAYRIERQARAAERAKAQRAADRDLAVVDGKITRIVRAIEEGTAGEALPARLRELEAERSRLAAAAPMPIADNVLAVHPNAAERYRQQVADIRSALEGGDAASAEAISLVRKLISAITLTPDSGGHQIAVDGDLSVILDGGMTTAVAGPRNQPKTQ